MDIIVPHSWLKDFLQTAVQPEKLGQCLSLCGPSVEQVKKVGKDSLYYIEVTTNRVDTAGVWGIAREASAILPRFGIKASLLPIKASNRNFAKHVSYLDAVVDSKLCPRFTAVLLKNVKLGRSPDWMKERLASVGLRPINNIVDISNYIMHELGQPAHTFDYDKIRDAKMVLRSSRAGEKITTLDGKTHELPSGDIVIEDGSGELIDLAGIMGGRNSAVDENTKNVLLFIQTYNSANIRKTSMKLACRTEAASLFEKGLDSEMVDLAIRRGIDLFVDLSQAQPADEILDIYPLPYKEKTIQTDLEFIRKRLGVDIAQTKVSKILTSLEFKVQWKNNALNVLVPSFRALDVNIPEDIVEEVARLYGYHNLPANLMSGQIPQPLADPPFDFEMKAKQILKGFGGIEVYTLTLVPKQEIYWILKLKNPLGSDTEYLRVSLAPSLVQTAHANPIETPFHLFEMSNVYLPVRNQLPEEKMMTAGVIVNTPYEGAKGTVEAFLNSLGVNFRVHKEDSQYFLPNRGLKITAEKEEIGCLGYINENIIYYEFDTELLRKVAHPLSSYKPIPRYPAQIEDLSLVIPPRILLGEVMDQIKKSDSQISSVMLVDTYDRVKTFRICYQNPDKTLTDQEVEKIRKKILKAVATKFGARPKE